MGCWQKVCSPAGGAYMLSAETPHLPFTPKAVNAATSTAEAWIAELERFCGQLALENAVLGGKKAFWRADWQNRSAVTEVRTSNKTSDRLEA
jgi:hypothetical protein